MVRTTTNTLAPHLLPLHVPRPVVELVVVIELRVGQLRGTERRVRTALGPRTQNDAAHTIPNN